MARGSPLVVNRRLIASAALPRPLSVTPNYVSLCPWKPSSGSSCCCRGQRFVPSSPRWTLDPHLALTLFVAPVLLDAAYDSSPRDLKDNWRSVASLAVIAVGVTTLAIALVVHWLLPGMPWPVAIALGAIVSPPDAAA